MSDADSLREQAERAFRLHVQLAISVPKRNLRRSGMSVKPRRLEIEREERGGEAVTLARRRDDA
jgi:hypothetical protein